MSKDQEEKVSLLVNWAAKIGFVILCFLATTFFNEMRNDIQQLRSDLSSIKERIARIEGSLNK